MARHLRSLLGRAAFSPARARPAVRGVDDVDPIRERFRRQKKRWPGTPLIDGLSQKDQTRIVQAFTDDVIARDLLRRARDHDLVASIHHRVLGWLGEEIQSRRRLEYDRHAIELVVGSEQIHKRLRAAQKEPFTVAWLERSVHPGTVVFDVGANVGAYTLIAAKLGADVYALEPSAPNVADLARNIALNGCEQGVTVLPVALWSESMIADFGYATFAAGGEGHTIAEAARTSPGASRQRVIAFGLDDLIELFDLPVPELIKIDVDGPELRVLQGATRTLADLRCHELMIEVDGVPGDPNPTAIQELLSRFGFSRAERHDRGLGSYELYSR